MIITNNETRPAQLLVDNKVTLEELLFLGLISIETAQGLVKEFEGLDLFTPLGVDHLTHKRWGVYFREDYIQASNECLIIWNPVTWKYDAKAKKAYHWLLGALTYVKSLKQLKGSLMPPVFLDNPSALIGAGCSSMVKRLAYIYHGVKDVLPVKEQIASKFLLADKEPTGFKGVLITGAEFLRHWWLPKTIVWDILSSVSKQVDEDWSMLNGHLIYKRADDGGVILQKRNRVSRDFYYLIFCKEEKGDLFAEEEVGEVWGNVLLHWFLQRTGEEGVSLRVNKKTTQLVASSRQYADPSPLNHAVDKGTVGRLRAMFSRQTAKATSGHCPVGFSFVNDEGPMSAAHAVCAILDLKDELYPVSIQHQIKDVRCGSAGGSLGKSTIKAKIVFKEGLTLKRKASNGKLVEKTIKQGHVDNIKLLVEQYNVDKAAKLFNRAALEQRVPPVVTVHRNEGFLSPEEEEKGEALLADLINGLLD